MCTAFIQEVANEFARPVEVDETCAGGKGPPARS